MIDGRKLRDAYLSAANHIQAQRQAVDALNVFPVPDGDTGTNMSMTIGNAVRELKKLQPGDAVTFTDMDGNVFSHEVMALETLAPTAVEEMTEGDWDLTLFTCTVGGTTRLAVRCEALCGRITARACRILSGRRLFTIF